MERGHRLLFKCRAGLGHSGERRNVAQFFDGWKLVNVPSVPIFHFLEMPAPVGSDHLSTTKSGSARQSGKVFVLRGFLALHDNLEKCSFCAGFCKTIFSSRAAAKHDICSKMGRIWGSLWK